MIVPFQEYSLIHLLFLYDSVSYVVRNAVFFNVRMDEWRRVITGKPLKCARDLREHAGRKNSGLPPDDHDGQVSRKKDAVPIRKDGDSFFVPCYNYLVLLCPETEAAAGKGISEGRNQA